MMLLAAIGVIPTHGALADFRDVLCRDYYGDASVSGNTSISGNNFSNNAYLSVSYNNLSTPNGGHNAAAAVLEYQPNVGYGVGPVTVSNGSGGTLRAVNSTPGGWAAGFWSDQIYGDPKKTELTLDNYGTAYGEGQSTGFGLYNYDLYGGAKIANHAGASATGKGTAFAVGINSFCYYGAIDFVNDGTATSVASGAASGDTTSYGINLFTYDSQSSAAAPLYCVNNGTAQASITGNGTNHCYGMFVWAQGGPMTLINRGIATGTASGNAEGVYCGSNYGDTYVENTGQMIGSGAPGYGLGMEVDSGNTMTLVNKGLIKNDTTSGQGQDGIWGGMGLVLWVNSGPTNIDNAANATIYGGNMGIWAGVYDGPITIHNSGNISGGSEAMHLGKGNDTVYLIGSATCNGVMDGGDGSNSLIFQLDGALQYVNGGAANRGSNLSAYGLGTSGSLVASGKTYTWRNFNVSGSFGTGVNNGTYKIISQNSGKALEAAGYGTSNGTQIQQWAYYGFSSQKWTLTNRGGWYSLINVGSGKSLDIYNGWSGNGTKAELWDYWGGAMQQFTFSDQGGGQYRITPNCATGSCLDVDGISKDNGAKVQLWQWLNGSNQKWSLQAP